MATLKFSRFINSTWEGFKISLSALGINKTRSILTTLCIIIGIVMVTLMNAVSNGMDAEFDKSMSMLGQNVVYVDTQPWNRAPDYEWWKYRSRRDMKLGYIDEIREASRLASDVSAEASRGAIIRYEEVSADGVFMSGVTGKYFDTAGLDIETGRVFTAEEVRLGAKVTVLGTTLAESLFERESFG